MQKSQEDESLDKEGEGRKSKKKGESTPHVSRKRYVINWWGDYKDQPDLWWVEKQWGGYFWEEETTESRSISPHPATRHHNLKQSNVRITLRHFFVTSTEFTTGGPVGWRSHVVPSVTSQRRRMGHRIGLLPGQQPTNPGAAEDEDPPHCCHSKATIKLHKRNRRDWFY